MANDDHDKVTAKNYALRTPNGGWLGQVVITSDGFFGAVTDYGNACYAWRAFGDNFEEFLLRIDQDYFAGKMVLGLAYTVQVTKRTEKAYERFAEEILPALQAKIREERAAIMERR